MPWINNVIHIKVYSLWLFCIFTIDNENINSLLSARLWMILQRPYNMCSFLPKMSFFLRNEKSNPAINAFKPIESSMRVFVHTSEMASGAEAAKCFPWKVWCLVCEFLLRHYSCVLFEWEGGCSVIYYSSPWEIYHRSCCRVVIYHFHIISDSENMQFYAFSFSNRSSRQISSSIKEF